MGEGRKVIDVETKKLDWGDSLVNSDEATVTTDDGKTATARTIGKENAVEAASRKAGVKENKE